MPPEILTLDYSNRLPEIQTFREDGYRVLYFYDAMFKMNFRVVWPLRSDLAIDHESASAYLKKAFDIDESFTETGAAHYVRISYFDQVDQHPVQVCLILLKYWKPEAFFIVILAHEVLHAVIDVLDLRGVKLLSKSNDEVFCYLQENWFHIILDALMDPFQNTPEDYSI